MRLSLHVNPKRGRFTSAPIARALVDAHRRGVKVQVVLDKSQRTEKYSSATFVYNSGIPCFIDAAHSIAHNKVMIIDSLTRSDHGGSGARGGQVETHRT